MPLEEDYNMKRKSPAGEALKALIMGMKQIELDKMVGFKNKKQVIEIEEVEEDEDDEDKEED